MTKIEENFDRREMEVVHTMLRREFALLPRLVLEADDAARTRVIADHFAFIADTLHHHHAGEDTYVWPHLAERVGESADALLRDMEGQHSELAIQLQQVRESMQKWSAGDSTQYRSSLLNDLNRLNDLLGAHLQTEEDLVVPLMEQHITANEWDQIVQKGAADADPESLPLGFGMLMYEGDPEIIQRALCLMPAEARPVIRKLAVEAYATHARLVHGTETPIRSTDV